MPIVVRLEGTNVSKGKEMLRESGIRVITADSLDEAADKAVSLLGHHEHEGSSEATKPSLSQKAA